MTVQSNKKEFLFAIPGNEPELTPAANVALQMGALASRQAAIKRTRCVHPDGTAENVAEHSLMLAKVAPELARLLYPDLDENLVARFACLHDDVEAYVGDIPTDMLPNLDQEAKDAKEAKGLAQLVKEYGHMPGYIALVNQYEAQSVAEARFVRAVDKLTVLLIHIPNEGAILRRNYTYESFKRNEETLLLRDGFKYGEFSKIIDLKRELGNELAERYLKP